MIKFQRRYYNFPLSLEGNGGFTMPLTLAIGAMVLLIGLTMITRSQQQRVVASSQKSVASSLEAAETGVTQLQKLLNTYRQLTQYCSQAMAAPSCSPDRPSWETVTAEEIEVNQHCPSALGQEGVKAIRGQNQALHAQEWTTIGSQTPRSQSSSPLGQYRLVSYSFRPTTAPGSRQVGQGRLVVEGRVLSDLNEFSAAAVTRLAVEFPVQTATVLASPGLWIQSHGQSAASRDTLLQTSIQDSSCQDKQNLDVVFSLQDSLDVDRQYRQTPGDPFPALLAPSGFLHIVNDASEDQKIFQEILTLGIQANLSLPPGGQAPIKTYRVGQQNGLSIRLTEGDRFQVGSGNDTVILHLEGGLEISEGGQIEVTSGSRLIIHVHGPIHLASHLDMNVIEHQGVPENVQIYSHTDDNVIINGDGHLKVFLFAPNAVVTQRAATLEGAVWAKSWQGLDNARLLETTLDASALAIGPRPKLEVGQVTLWQRESGL